MNSRALEHFCWRASLLYLLLVAPTSCSAKSPVYDVRDPRSPLHLVRTIALPGVRGRIDHMAIDPARSHLFVAELANGSLDDVDLGSGRVAGRISGLHEPQGVAFLAAQNELTVACGDGTLHFYRNSDRQEVARISLGDDADNVRVDSRTGQLVVGYGSGALAVIDPSTHRIVRRVKLQAHPEAFEILGSHAFVNVPHARQIVIVDLDRGRVVQTLGTGAGLGNYPMASDSRTSRIAVAFRFPSTLSVIDARSGHILLSEPICSDADDLYYDADRLLVACGEGTVDVASVADDHRIARVATEPGARTALFDRAGDRLFIAVPEGKTAAAIWEFSVRSPRRSNAP